MGLDIAVGVLALQHAEGASEQEIADFARQFEPLNAILGEAGLAPHREPTSVATTFEAQMFGYGGLHTVRRLAAWLEIKGGPPPDSGRNLEASRDPVLERLYSRLLDFDGKPAAGGRPRSLLGRIFSRSPGAARKPMFQHLLFHSDAEGFYVPQPFEDVVFDAAATQRPGVGGMVGSSVRLLEECRTLAGSIGLPPDLDPESDELWALADSPPQDGPAWKRLGVESFCLARLLRAAALSVDTGAAIVFR